MFVAQKLAIFLSISMCVSCVPPDARRPGSGIVVLNHDFDSAQGAFLVAGSDRIPVQPVIVPARPFDGPAALGDSFEGAAECLTEAVYYEARSEGEGGQRAVAQVVLNRVRHRAYPSTICGVVHEGSNRSSGCQFTFTCDGSLLEPRDDGAWNRASRIAAEALGGYVHKPVGLATHYHTMEVQPSWSRKMIQLRVIGEHRFFRWRGSKGEPMAFTSS